MTMNVVAMVDGGLDVVEVPIPQPGPGEVLVKTLAAGICGSDLHALAHGADLIAGVKAVAGVEILSSTNPSSWATSSITNELTGDEITPDRCYELAGSVGRSDG